MEKNCKTCMWCDNILISKYETADNYCYKNDCFCNEVKKEQENPSCWENDPPEYDYDSHTCDYENGCCKICGKVEYKSMLYCELYGCDP